MTGTDGKRSSLLAVGLFVSLAVNVFLAGWLIGRQSNVRRPSPPAFDHFFNEHIRSSLSPAGAQRMETALDTIRREFAHHESDAKSARERVYNALAADRFDSSEYLAASRALHLERDRDREAADEELVRAIAQLSPDDRRKLAEIRHHPPGSPRAFGGFH